MENVLGYCYSSFSFFIGHMQLLVDFIYNFFFGVFQHETGLCKNLLQEYAQKMNYAIPMYVCQKDESPSRVASFSCTVEIGGIHYIGAAARTKKEAEIKAARTALLAIQASADGSGENSNGNIQLTVIPRKKKGTETDNVDEPVKALKPKKARFKTKARRKKFPGNKVGNNQVEDKSGTEVVDTENKMGSKENVEEEKMIVTENGGNKTVAEGDTICDFIANGQNGQATASDVSGTNGRIPELGIASMTPEEVLVTVAMEVNKASEAGLLDSAAIIDSSNEAQTQTASAAKDLNQMGAIEDDLKAIVAPNLG